MNALKDFKIKHLKTQHFKALSMSSAEDFYSNINEIWNSLKQRICKISNNKSLQKTMIILLTTVFTGLRQNEVVNIKVSDIDFKNKILIVPNTKTIKEHHGDLPFKIPLTKEMIILFRKCIKQKTIPIIHIFLNKS